MNNLAFTGFLKVKDMQNTECCLNTKNIIGAYQKENSPAIDIKSTDGSKITLSGYEIAEVYKALIEAEQKGSFELENKKPNKNTAAETIQEKTNLKAAIETTESKKDDFIPPVLDKPAEGKPVDDIFSYIEKKNGITAYCPNSLSSLNSNLRQHHSSLSEEYNQNLIKTCDLAFKKLPPLDKETTFYRGTYGSNLPQEVINAKVGDIITPDEGYAQVGVDQYTAETYLPTNEDCMPVLFKMVCPKGAKVSHTEPRNTGNGYQHEGMMPRGQKFKVLKKEKENIVRNYPSWSKPREILTETIPATVYTLEYLL